MSKIDKSKITLDDFIRILELSGGSLEGFSRFASRSNSYYYNKLYRNRQLHEADKSQLEKYLTDIGSKTTFEDSYNAMMAEKTKREKKNETK